MAWQFPRSITPSRRKLRGHAKYRSRAQFTRLLSEPLEERQMLTTTLFSDNFESGL